MDLGLKGKIALLTGASSGLGFATAKTLAAEGVRITINSRSPERLERAKSELAETGAEVLTLPGDVSDPATPEKLVEDTVSAFGGLDLLFTNSGGPPPMRFEDVDDDAWQSAVELAFLSHVRLIRAGAARAAPVRFARGSHGHLGIGQAAHPRAGALQQRAGRHSRPDQNPRAGIGRGWHPLQLDPPLLDADRTGGKTPGGSRPTQRYNPRTGN